MAEALRSYGLIRRDDISLRLRVILAVTDARPGEIARRVGCTPEHLSRVLHGKSRPSPSLAARIESAVLEGSRE